MGDGSIATVRGSSPGGLTGSLKNGPDQVAFVAPTVRSDKNVIASGIIPIACWRVDDIRFDFDSSFVLPEIADEMALLAELRKEHELTVAGTVAGAAATSIPPPLSIFGHADPTGSDDYNKQLSGRRATAIYAMLIRDTKLWEALFSQTLGGDNWGRRSLQTMLTTVDPALETDPNRLEGETNSAQSNAGKRSSLFSSYMDKLCGDLKLEKDDFLGATDAGGKGDYQGCGEFNPILLFSSEEEEEFQKEENKPKRNLENAPNRRVIALLFRPGSKVDPKKWPCPRAKEGPEGCRKRFWSDGEARRSRHDSQHRRRFEESKDTFACRFYHRIASLSPCEALESLIQIQLLYEDKSPMAEAEFDAMFDEIKVSGKTDKDGRATILRPENGPAEFLLFLNAFPERYTGSEEQTGGEAKSNALVAQGDDASEGSKRAWPHNILASLLVASLMFAQAASAFPVEADAPAVNVSLRGPLYRDDAAGTMELKLTVLPARPAGTVTYGASGTFTMVEPKLEILDASEGRIRYRLLYATDSCEHATPLKRTAMMTKWDPCYFRDGEPRPVRLVHAEVLLLRTRAQTRDLFVAAGIPDVQSLSEVFRATGSTIR